MCDVLYLGMSNLREVKIPQRGDGGDGSRCQNCKFWNPFLTFGTGVVRNFKFGTLVDFGMSHLMDDKIFPLKCVVGSPRLIISDPPKKYFPISHTDVHDDVLLQ